MVVAGGIPVRGLNRSGGPGLASERTSGWALEPGSGGQQSRSSRAGEGLLLLGHGSRCHLSEREMQLLGDLVARELPSTAVEVGFLEMSRPPAAEAIDSLVRGGCKRVAVLPLVLLAAGHAKSDSPAVVLEARERYPEVDFRFGTPLGVAREPVELLGKSVVAGGGAGLPLLVLARGSSDPDANSDAYKAARLVAEWTGSPFVNVGFSGITDPSVSEAAETMVRLGYPRVAVAWWFLCHGRLVERGRAEVAEVFGSAGVEQVDAGYIGPDPALVPLIVRRYLSAVGDEDGLLAPGGAATAGDELGVNCDMCSYRAPWPGREDRVGQPIGVGHSHLAVEHRHKH